ncbi:MAG: hypothetical protein AAB706_00865 [Patescibacteria group bacterium]
MEDINKVLADVKQEGTDPFAGMEKATPSESPTEKKPEEEVKKEVTPEEPIVEPKDEDVPFHKHPRWIEREKELEELREKDEQRSREIAELTAFKEETSKKLQPTTDIPSWFVELYGDNQVAWAKYSEYERDKEDGIERRFEEKQVQKAIKQREEEKGWIEFNNREFDKLEGEGKKFDRNRLAKILLDYAPTDVETGNLDFQKGYQIYEALEAKIDPEHSLARKQLADTTTGSQKGEKKAKDYLTNNDLRNRSMGSL